MSRWGRVVSVGLKALICRVTAPKVPYQLAPGVTVMLSGARLSRNPPHLPTASFKQRGTLASVRAMKGVCVSWPVWPHIPSGARYE